MSKQWTRCLQTAANSATAAVPPVTQPFVPRATFDVPGNISRSYYLGHHHAGLREITTGLSKVGLILECRDFRVPLTAWNTHLEKALGGRRRIIVYTKTDLGEDSKGAQKALREMHRSKPGESALFVKKGHRTELLNEIRKAAVEVNSITGLRVYVVGMPNAGKSTLINALRRQGMQTPSTKAKAKVAKTGDHPGITRKLSTPVRIMGDKADAAGPLGEGVFVIDTPGVFMPFVSDGESMVKLALTHGVRDNIVPHEIVADYLLYKMNKWDPALYAKYCPPTNDVGEFLAAVARRTGKHEKKAGFSIQAAIWIIHQWRQGNLGKYILDDVTAESIEAKTADQSVEKLSMNQARKREKAARKQKAEEKRRGG